MLVLATLLWSASVSAGGGYIVGTSGEADTSNGRAISVFVDYGLTEKTWLAGALAKTNTGGDLGGLDTIYMDASVEHSFGLVGLKAGAAYWGDDDILDSNDLRGSIFFRTEKGSITVNYEVRDFDFVFSRPAQSDVVRTAEFSATGIGGAGWLKVGNSSSLYVSGMVYEYSRDIRLQENIDNLRFLSTSRLSLMNSLIDYRVSGGMDFQFGSKIFDLTLSTWQTALDGGRVNSIAVGFTAPSGIASDLDLRLAYDDSQNYGSTVAFAVSFYFFGI